METMPTEPLVSVITTVFNGELFLADAIQSVLAQTYNNWELIIVDDGSTDHSPGIATQNAQTEARIRCYEIAHQGRIQALQYAHQQAKGSLLGYLDADDKLHPEALARTVTYLNSEPKCGLVYTNNIAIDSAGKIMGEGPHNKIPYSPQALLRDFMTFHFRLMRASIFKAIGGINPYSGRAEDYDLCLRFSEVTHISHLPEPLYYYRLHSRQISQVERQKQVTDSVNVIQNALLRRGLADRIQIEVNPNSTKFKLTKRQVNKEKDIDRSC